MDRPTPTDSESTMVELARHALARRPGLVLVFAGQAPLLRVFPVGRGLSLGRGALPDEKLSRVHAEVRWVDGRWRVKDLGSRNGTFADGQRVEGNEAVGFSRVLRLADSVFLPVPDVTPFEELSPDASLDDGVSVAGPTLRRALGEIRQAAARAEGVLVTGESGAGKELAARTFHAASPYRDGPFVAVNCATIAQGVAERLLFGARRGAYSGADADAVGYLQASHRGVLFLDEMGELDLLVQAKLLRVLETKEVLPLGAVKPVPVETAICWATNRDLRESVADGRFRADLFYRIGSHHVALPPLRQRPEEIPALVIRAVGAVERALRVRSQFVESCLLRPWPGNVRELLGAVRAAAGRALAAGDGVVTGLHLDASAGLAITPARARTTAARVVAEDAATPDADTAGLKKAVSDAERRRIENALAETRGNREQAARRLGVSVRTLYYKLRTHGLG